MSRVFFSAFGFVFFVGGTILTGLNLFAVIGNQFDVQLSDVFANAIGLVRQFFYPIFDWIDLRAPWALPDWNRDYLSLMLLIILAISRGMGRFMSKNRGLTAHLQGMLMTAVLIGFLVVFPAHTPAAVGVTLAFVWCTVAYMLYTPVIYLAKLLGLVKIADGDDEISVDDQGKFAIYLWGCVFAAVVFAVWNGLLLEGATQ